MINTDVSDLPGEISWSIYKVPRDAAWLKTHGSSTGCVADGRNHDVTSIQTMLVEIRMWNSPHFRFRTVKARFWLKTRPVSDGLPILGKMLLNIIHAKVRKTLQTR